MSDMCVFVTSVCGAERGPHLRARASASFAFSFFKASQDWSSARLLAKALGSGASCKGSACSSLHPTRRGGSRRG
eukprot:602280-Prorocentrum_minimum.AAC.1